jgi:ABC-2 type transport system ATP-binding protein
MSTHVTIRVEGLRFSYPGAEVLHGVSFAVNRGEVTGLIGPNGAGKSTTLRILTGMVEASSGSVEVDGCVLPRQAFELKQRIGYVPEAAELYETLSAQEFLELCGRLHEIEEPSLQARITSLLSGFELEEERNQRLATYSKGMRQKVLIAAALVHDPSLLVLDEPLTGLDANAAALVKALFSALAAAGKTVLYSSHVLDVVERVCARVLILDRGAIIADGSPEELMAGSHERTLEDVFREVTHAERVEPRVASMLDGLKA